MSRRREASERGKKLKIEMKRNMNKNDRMECANSSLFSNTANKEHCETQQQPRKHYVVFSVAQCSVRMWWETTDASSEMRHLKMRTWKKNRVNDYEGSRVESRSHKRRQGENRKCTTFWRSWFFLAWTSDNWNLVFSTFFFSRVIRFLIILRCAERNRIVVLQHFLRFLFARFFRFFPSAIVCKSLRLLNSNVYFV